MWEFNPKLDKYLYVRTSPAIIRILGLIGVLTTLLATYGFIRFFNLSVWYWLFLGPIAFIFTLRKLTIYLLQSIYPKFDIIKHENSVETFWQKNNEPAVDIFLPWAGEELEIYEEVLKGVSCINYSNKAVYVLDDKGSNSIRELATQYGFAYLSRPNKGEHKKAGNLQFGYNNSSGKYVLVLDADFIPHKDILKDLVPYMELDNKIGILQTPQFFEQNKKVHERSEIEFGGGNIVEGFYRIDMPSRDRFKAAICVGTSAIYRKEAIVAAGGTPKNMGSEDVQQGLMVTQAGYYVKYLPLVLSIGKSPETVQSYFSQHNRWCAGSIYAFFGEHARKAKLGLIAHWIYFTNIGYYLSEAFGILFSFHALALLFFHADNLSLLNIIWFLPYAIYSRLLVPSTKIKKSRWGTQQAAISNSFTYLYTILNVILGKSYTWVPAGLKLTKAEQKYIRAIDLGVAISVLYVGLMIVILWNNPSLIGNYNAYPILFWSFYSAVSYVAFFFMASSFLKKIILRELQISQFNFSILSKKVFAYARTYTLPSFALILFSTVTFNGYSVLQNPTVPTNIALNQLSDTIVPSSSKSEGGMSIENDLPLTQIQLEETKAEEEKKTISVKEYTFKAKHGDSITKLAVRAVRRYSIQEGVNLSKKQIERVASLIAFHDNRHLQISEEVSFSKELINKYIKEALYLSDE